MNADRRDGSTDPGHLAWSSTAPGSRSAKPRLTRQRIVAAAVSIADAEGLPALSMQHLATTLDAGTMSLYRHVPNKDELIGLALDHVIGPPPTAELETGNWRSDLERWARLNLEIFRQHPWALSLVGSSQMMGPNETAWLEAGLRAISDLGLSAVEMLHTMLLVNSFVRGTAEQVTRPMDRSVDAVAGRSPSAAELERLGVADHYPVLLQTLTVFRQHDDELHHRQDNPIHPEDTDPAFSYGLERILDGIEAHLR